MFLLFGLMAAVVFVPLLFFAILAGLVGRAVARSSWRIIVAAAIAAVLLGFSSGYHAALFAAVAVGLEQAWRERRMRRVPRGQPNPWIRQARPTSPRPAPSALETAWSRAAIAVRGDERIAAARARCAELLVRAQAEPDDAALADWAEVIRRRVPELVDAASAAAADASTPERAALAGDLADALDQIGAEAAARLGARRLAARDRFDTLRGYVRNRTASERDWL